MATDQPYTAGAGTNARDGDVDVLAAVVVAAQPNQGTVVLTLVNGSREGCRAQRPGGRPDLEVDEFEPVELAARGGGQPRRRGRDPGQR